MANSLDTDLTGKTVVIRAEALRAEYGAIAERLFHVEDGFGAVPFTRGSALFGRWVLQGTAARVDGYDVERIATEEDLRAVAAP